MVSKKCVSCSRGVAVKLACKEGADVLDALRPLPDLHTHRVRVRVPTLLVN